MRLPQPFYRLPVRFDAARLQAELESLPESAWAKHPSEIEGNSSIRLISANGGENDDLRGVMRPTPHLQACPYVRQVLASFGVVWGRSRFMRLGPRSSVPKHADTSSHWFSRVRMHIPVVTWPEVRFYCDQQDVHMAAGEAWLFDNWRLHRVENPTDHTRVHLVADTSGTSTFWRYVAQSTNAPPERLLAYRDDIDPHVPTELAAARPVMAPAEVELLTNDLIMELTAAEEVAEATANLPKYVGLLNGFCYDWRQLYALHGESPAGAKAYASLLEALRNASRPLAYGLVMQTNRVAAHTVLETRVLSHALRVDELPPPGNARSASRPAATPASQSLRTSVDRPIFIVAAPRSGSTLLFETLAVSPALHTLGGEAHWLVESIAALRPGAAGVDSNRLDARHATDAVAAEIGRSLAGRMVDADRRPALPAAGMRWLEKTPKNALRIPFFDRLFPDSLFVFLWRDPRENVSSIIEAWKAGQWVTYPRLEGWDGPWSMLLPPGWRALQGRPLHEVAAAQWDITNRTVLADLRVLPAERWMSLQYSELVGDPRQAIATICRFAGLDFDAALQSRVSAALPESRHTLTPPARDKWRSNEAAIEAVLPQLEPTWRDLEALNPRSDNRIVR